MALPLITEFTHFTGKIFATEPTIEFGRLLMNELVHEKEKYLIGKDFLRRNFNPIFNNPLYSIYDINSCIEKIQHVHYGEILRLSEDTKVIASSSGYCLGGTNWTFLNSDKKVVYLSLSSVQHCHQCPLQIEPLLNPDALVISGGIAHSNIHDINDSMKKIVSTIMFTLKNCGNVIIPALSCGIIFDILDCLSIYTKDIKNHSYHVISPIAKHSLHYSGILSEWMNDKLKERVFQQDEPMRCNEMLTNGQLHTHFSIQDFFKNKKSESSIIFIDHPSLNMGDVIPLINLWKNDQKNALILITPTDNVVEMLNNFQPIYMNVQYFPIDIRLTDKQFKDLIIKINPKEVLLPESHFKPSRLSVTYPDDGLYLKYGLKSYHLYNRNKIKTAYITEELAKKQFPKHHNESCLYYLYRGILEFTNGKIYIKSLKAYEDSNLDVKYEEIDIQDLCQKITDAGLGETLVEKSKDDYTVIKLPVYHALLKFNSRSILIETSNNKIRKRVFDIIKNIFENYEN
jgi:integrator complex subunit 9